MNANQAYVHPASTSETISARTLFEHREEILAEWMNRVKSEVKSAGGLVNPVIINTIPLFIERLSESLCAECTRETATESSNFAQEHGSERARVTRYGPEQVIQEFQILREVIRRKILRHTSLDEREENVIQKSFDKGIQESMIAYFLVHGRLREQFIAGLTHDLRNPIGGVKLAADLILDTLNEERREPAIAEVKVLAHHILKLAKRSDRMIQDMLDASTVQVGERLALRISKCDVDDIVKEAIADLPERDRARLKVESLRFTGYWDPDAFRRSIENLVSNAFKYGDEATPITVRVKEAHQRVMVSIHNYGNPIPAESMESLFQVFRRAEAAKVGKVKGWGIGLAMARSTTERMGGSLGVDSSAEQGTTFTIDVPSDARPFQETMSLN